MKVNLNAAGLAKNLEAHVEKILLGLGGVYLLVMAWFFIINSPNSIEFENRTVNPGELNAAIGVSADNLKRAFDNAKTEQAKVEAFSNRLKDAQSQGLFAAPAAGSLPLRPQLRLAERFGAKIEVPGLEDAEQTNTPVELATPLPPSPPVTSVGRSLVTLNPMRLTTDRNAKPAEVSTEEIEQPWVTVAAYFDKTAQEAAFASAGYAASRQHVYLAGVDVQRRERLADGTWSEWQDVKAGKAMPSVDLVEPKFDDLSGAVTNREDVDQEFRLVKESQTLLMQPAFPTVSEGDDWKMPELAGFEHEEEEAKTPDTPKVKEAPPPPVAGPRGGSRMAPAGGGGGGGGRGGAGRFAGGGGVEGGRSPGAGAGAAAQAQQEKEAARKQIIEDLKDAKKAVSEKNWQQVKNLCDSVIASQFANQQNKSDAKRLLKRADKELEKTAKAGNPTGGAPVALGGRGAVSGEGGGNPRMPGGRAMGMSMSPVAQTASAALVTEPNGTRPAVWSHDDTVESGKTYSYRMRVKVWNRYVGQAKYVKKPDDARKAIIAGEWSVPSDPVTVTPSTYFFAKAAKVGGGGATVDIWKWRKGAWLKQSFEVNVGDQIGAPRKVTTDEDIEGKKTEVDFTTGAIVLDIRPTENIMVRVPGKNGAFAEREQNSMVLVYLDPADGQVKERIPALDRYDPVRKQLEEAGG